MLFTHNISYSDILLLNLDSKVINQTICYKTVAINICYKVWTSDSKYYYGIYIKPETSETRYLIDMYAKMGFIKNNQIFQQQVLDFQFCHDNNISQGFVVYETTNPNNIISKYEINGYVTMGIDIGRLDLSLNRDSLLQSIYYTVNASIANNLLTENNNLIARLNEQEKLYKDMLAHRKCLKELEHIKHDSNGIIKDLEAFDDLQLDFIETKIKEIREQRKICKICLDQSSSVVCIPCGHMCMCISCKEKYIIHNNLTETKCPICREIINDLIRIY